MPNPYRQRLRGLRPFFLLLLWAVFALYLYQLDGQSLWRDEILSVSRARQPVSQIVRNINIVTGVESPDLHPPFYFLLLSLWRQLLGESAFAYRYLSVLALLLAVPLFYACGRRLWGRAAGGATAVFAAFSPFYLWYAQETRMYALLVAESLFVIYTLWPLLWPRPQRRDYVACGVALGLTVYTHYSGLFLLGFSFAAVVFAQLAHRWADGSLRRLATAQGRRWLGITAVLLILLLLLSLPLLPNLIQLTTASGFIAFSQQTPWSLLQQGVTTFALGSAEAPPIRWWQFVPFGLLALVGAVSWVSPPPRRWRAALLATGGLLGVLTLFYAASFLQANFSNPRHLMLLSPFWFLLLGQGWATIWYRQRLTAVLLGTIPLIFAVLALQQTITQPPVQRDDVRGLASYIAARAQPGDRVIWHNAVMSLVYDYYEERLPASQMLPVAVLPRYNQADPNVVLSELAELQANSQRLWFVRYPSPPFFDETLLYNQLQANWVSLGEKRFGASWATLGVELFQPLQLVDALPADALIQPIQQGDYTIHGLQLPPVATTERGGWGTLFWEYAGSPPPTSPQICLNLRDGAAVEWRESCTRLQLPAKQQPVGILAQAVWLPLPLGLAPVPHELRLEWDGETVLLGEVVPQRPFSSATLPARTSFANGLNLVEVDWHDNSFHTGFWVLADLVWQTTEPITADLTLRAQLVDWLGRPLAEETLPVAPAGFAERDWQLGDLVRTRLVLPVPYRLQGRYRLRLSLLEDAGERETAVLPIATWLNRPWQTLGRVVIEDWPLLETPPADSQPIAAAVVLGDEAIELAAYDLTTSDETLTLTLYWRNQVELDQNYGTFVHVGWPGEAPLAQGGGPNLERPIQSWRDGEIIAQQFTIPLPADAQGLPIRIGMYDLKDPNQRLPLHVDGVAAPDQAYTLAVIP